MVEDPRRSAALHAWERWAGALEWSEPFDKLWVPDERGGRWLVGGRLNVAVNCLDRHLDERGDHVALHWEGEPGDRRSLTYRELHAEACALSEALRGLGVAAGDTVGLHLGWLTETVVAMLACARLGAIHALLPTPLPADALADRLGDLSPKVLFTQDAAWRHGVMLPLKARADEALAASASVEHTVVVRRTGVDVDWFEGDRWYHELMAAPRPARRGGRRAPDLRGSGRAADRLVPAIDVDADHPLLVVHLANRRGRPAGVVHGSGGLLTYAAALHRDGLAAGDDEVFWCAADIAWLAGQTHGVYGPLACGATAVMFEGTLDTPTRERAWQTIARYGVTSLVTTPSVVRNLRDWVDSPPGEQVSTLRRIVTIGEAIEPDTRRWLASEVGRGRASIADGWGQTELGGVVTVTPPSRDTLPDAGLDIVDGDGRALGPGERGVLVMRNPWPATFLRLLGDNGDAAARYWRWPGLYTTDDEARRDGDGLVTIVGRTDPVIGVSGQLVSAVEVRDVLLEHPFVAAAEVIHRPDRRSGQAVVACVVLAGDATPGQAVARDLQAHVRDTLGGLARPRTVAFCEWLPAGEAPGTLRRALWTLCAASSASVLRISATQLRAALTAAESEPT